MFIYNNEGITDNNLYYLMKYGKYNKWVTTAGKGEWEHYFTFQFVNSHLTFTDKESYLAWVASWKEMYKGLTKKVRWFRLHNKKIYWEKLEPGDREKMVKSSPPGDWYNLYTQARLVLMIRKAGKVKSWQMKQNSLLSVEG